MKTTYPGLGMSWAFDKTNKLAPIVTPDGGVHHPATWVLDSNGAVTGLLKPDGSTQALSGGTLPSQTGKGGYTLQTDGSTAIWVEYPEINVKDPHFAAKGDGSTNDYAALRAVFDLQAVNECGVVFPPGVYLTGQPLVLSHDHVQMRGVVPPTSGRGPTDSPARDNDCVIIKATASGVIPMIIGKNINSSGVGSGRDFLYRPQLKNLRFESAADANYALLLWHLYHGIIENVNTIGPIGNGKRTFGTYGDVDCVFRSMEFDGLGFGTVAGTLAAAASYGAEFGFGYQVDTPTTRTIEKCYSHYCQTGYLIGGASDMRDSVAESCLYGFEFTENWRGTNFNLYTENIVNEGGDFVWGKNILAHLDGWEGLIYAAGRTKGMKGANISGMVARNLKPQFNQTSTPALFDSSLDLYGNLYSDGTAGSNVANAVALLQVLVNKEGFTLGGGSHWTADKVSIDGMQRVPYDFTVVVPSQYYNGTIACVPATNGFGDSDGYFMPSRCHVVGVQVLLGTNLANGSFDVDVKTNESGSFVATKVLDHAGTVGTKRDYPGWLKPFQVKLQAGDKLKLDFIANTIDATATHKIRVWVDIGPDGRGQMKY